MKHALARAQKRLIPASVLLTLTHRCQLACAHCYQAQHDSHDLTFDELTALFDELQLLGTLELTFTGGEALLRKDCLELIAEARRRGFAVTLFSNGGPITPQLAQRLRELRVMSVEISLHAAHAALHDGLVGRAGAFDKAVRAVELLDDQGIPVVVKSNVLRCNADEVLRLRELFSQRPRVRFLADVLVHARDDGAALGAQRPGPDQIDTHFARELAAQPDEAMQALAARLDSTAPFLDREPCGAGRTFAAVQPNGDVLPCVHVPALPMGNLREKSFSELWLASPAARQLRALTVARFEECRGCEYQHVCAKCPALSFSESGRLEGHSRQVCDRTKSFWGAVKTRLGRAPSDQFVQNGRRPLPVLP
jgi:radical SAM protein with 4Fe4S-binding SPASM domain